ncbi:MAG: prolyl oligopeptidase family serine peptidase [Bacteroidota bacterium]
MYSINKSQKLGGIFSLILMFLIGYARWNQSGCQKRISYSTIHLNEGIDLDRLYAPPSQGELLDIQKQWEAFKLQSDSFKFVADFSFGTHRKGKVILQHAGKQKHYGAIIFPSAYTELKTYPLLVWANGLNQVLPQVDLDRNTLRKALFDKLGNYFLVIPSFRGQELRVQGKSYCSDGFFGDAFDGACSDALRLMHLAKSEYSSIDARRTVFCGVSRGGTVALLAGIRDSSIQTVVSIAGPTNFFSKEAYYRYGKQYKYQFLSYTQVQEEIRKKILKSSPLHFVDFLKPSLLLIHGKSDRTVHISHAEHVVEKLRNKENFKPVLVDGGHQLEEWDRVEQWIRLQNK